MELSITIIIVAITAVVSILAFQRPHLMEKMLMHPYIVSENGEYYRFLSSGFIHNDWLHLIINMFVLWSFGQAVEVYYSMVFGDLGAVFYILMYLLALIASEIPTYLKHRKNYQYRSLGASGAVSGVVFASIIFNPWNQIYIYGLIGIPGIILGILYLVYSAVKGRQGGDYINHDAHFYGAIFGMLFTIALKPSLAIHFYHELIGGLPI